MLSNQPLDTLGTVLSRISIRNAVQMLGRLEATKKALFHSLWDYIARRMQHQKKVALQLRHPTSKQYVEMTLRHPPVEHLEDEEVIKGCHVLPNYIAASTAKEFRVWDLETGKSKRDGKSCSVYCSVPYRDEHYIAASFKGSVSLIHPTDASKDAEKIVTTQESIQSLCYVPEWEQFAVCTYRRTDRHSIVTLHFLSKSEHSVIPAKEIYNGDELREVCYLPLKDAPSLALVDQNDKITVWNKESWSELTGSCCACVPPHRIATGHEYDVTLHERSSNAFGNITSLKVEPFRCGHWISTMCYISGPTPDCLARIAVASYQDDIVRVIDTKGTVITTINTNSDINIVWRIPPHSEGGAERIAVGTEYDLRVHTIWN